MCECVCSDGGSLWGSVWENLSFTPNDLTDIVNYDIVGFNDARVCYAVASAFDSDWWRSNSCAGFFFFIICFLYPDHTPIIPGLFLFCLHTENTAFVSLMLTGLILVEGNANLLMANRTFKSFKDFSFRGFHLICHDTVPSALKTIIVVEEREV